MHIHVQVSHGFRRGLLLYLEMIEGRPSALSQLRIKIMTKIYHLLTTTCYKTKIAKLVSKIDIP